MILWRISNHAALDGGGGLRAAGRWHSRGRRIVYCAPNPATVLLEVLVHAEIDAEDVPITFRFLEIEAPDSVTVETADARALGSGWQRNPELTRPPGDWWLRSGRTTLLRVPSAIVPATWNVVINRPREQGPKLVRGDTAWGTQRMLLECEKRSLPNLIKIRPTTQGKRHIAQWFRRADWAPAVGGWQGLSSELYEYACR